MAINWDYCEPWMTAAGNNLVAYPARPKPAYYAVKASLRPVLASARIPRFDWNAGENFHAEIWLLNDSPKDVSKDVRVSIEINGTSYYLLTWQTCEVPANTNKLGPAVNFTLPNISADWFTLVLDTGDDAQSRYCLRLRGCNAAEANRQLNV